MVHTAITWATRAISWVVPSQKELQLLTRLSPLPLPAAEAAEWALSGRKLLLFIYPLFCPPQSRGGRPPSVSPLPVAGPGVLMTLGV